LHSLKNEKNRIMKVVILAGGYGTRITEESHLKPKPMIEIGEKPILWHIMKIYSHYGFNDFIVCAGYKQHVVKEWFADYYLHNSDVTFDFSNENKMTVHTNESEPWKVTIVNTGLNTMTGGRVKRIQKYIGNEPFMLTYGDGIANIDIQKLVEFHQSHGKWATITTVNVAQRFGVIDIDENNSIKSFREKSKTDSSVINGGFMVLQPEIFDHINGDDTVFEKQPLEKMAELNNLKGFHHDGFWHCMDTQRDKNELEEMWQLGKAPWKMW
jgi:glucose-1-phosphate cytidylyltransferase